MWARNIEAFGPDDFSNQNLFTPDQWNRVLGAHNLRLVDYTYYVTEKIAPLWSFLMEPLARLRLNPACSLKIVQNAIYEMYVEDLRTRAHPGSLGSHIFCIVEKG